MSRVFISKLKKQLESQSGIGLVETLVAIAILGLSAVSFISSLSAGSISVKTLDEQTITHRLLTSQMEVIKSLDYDVSGISYPAIDAPEGYTLVIKVDSQIYDDIDIQKITASVTHDGKLVAQLENFKSNR